VGVVRYLVGFFLFHLFATPGELANSPGLLHDTPGEPATAPALEHYHRRFRTGGLLCAGDNLIWFASSSAFPSSVQRGHTSFKVLRGVAKRNLWFEKGSI
jgi:hypothetical protein